MNVQQFIAFDIDGTVWPFDIENMWLNKLVSDGVLHAEVIEENQKFLRGHMEGSFDEQGYLDFFINQFRGWHISKLQHFSEEVFDKYAKNNLYKEATSIIEKLKKDGKFVFLLTAANNIAAAPFGRHLGIDIVISTELEFDTNQYLTGNIIKPYCYGIGKVKKTQELFRSINLDLKNGTYFGDSPSDIWMFEQMGRCVVVNPNPELEKVSRINQWEIVNWSM